jgi:hypothetical protein
VRKVKGVVLFKGLPARAEGPFNLSGRPLRSGKMNKVQVLEEFFFSQIQGKPIYDHEGHQVGQIRDLAVRWERETPEITGLKYAKGSRSTSPSLR